MNRDLFRHHLTCIDALSQALSIIIADMPQRDGEPDNFPESVRTLAHKITSHAEQIAIYASQPVQLPQQSK